MKHLENQQMFENRSTIQAGINHLVRKYTKLGCKVELVPRYNDSVYLTLIQVPPELSGKGLATQFMKDLVNWANSLQLVITLSPTNTLGSSIERLEEFYSRFGFIKNRANHRDSRYVGAMIKFPEKI